MTTELSGLELRKALCEALGFKIVKRAGLYACSHGDRIMGEWWVSQEQAWPHLESSPSVFWFEFLKWKDEIGANATAHIGGRYGGYCFEIRRFCGEEFAVKAVSTSSLTEAGCHAWLQALRLQDRAPQSAGSSNDSPQGRKSKSPSEKS